MPDRAAKSVAAILVSILAGAPLATVSFDAARADDCLGAPKAETPEGSHWYYRIDHASKRHCWYLRAEGERPAQTAPANSPVASQPVAAPLQRSVANAHAELPAQANAEPPIRADAAAPAMPANPTVSPDNVASSADTSRSLIASRWLDPASVGSVANRQPEPTTGRLAANVPAAPPSDSSSSSADLSQADQTDSPAAVAATPSTPADSPQGLPASMSTLLAVMSGALALAAFSASLVLKFAGARRAARVRVRREQIWESADDDWSSLAARLDAEFVPRRPFPRDLDEPAEPNDRATEFYAQLSKQARS